MKKISIVLAILIIGVSFYRGNQFKENLIYEDINEIIKDESNLDVSIDLQYGIDGKPNNVDDLFKESDAILIVEILEDSRIGFQSDLLTTVRVKDIIKGEDVEDEIYIYEDISINPSWYGYPQPPKNGEVFYSYTSHEGSNLMKLNEEYIVFLDKLDKNPMQDDTQTFNILYGKWGKYNINENEVKVKTEETSLDMMYEDIKYIDVFVSSEDEKKIYMDFIGKIKKEININT